MHLVVGIQTQLNPEDVLQISEDALQFAGQENSHFISEFDLNAIEAALQLREMGVVKQVTAITVGAQSHALRKAYALGVDQALQIQVDTAPPMPQGVVNAMAHVLQDLSFDYLLLGRLGVLYESMFVPQALAEALHIPCIHHVEKLIHRNEGLVAYSRKEKHIQQIRLPNKAILCTELRIAEARIPSMPQILRAKSKPITILQSPVHAQSLHHKALGLQKKPIKEKKVQWITACDLGEKLKKNEVTG